MKSSAKQRNCIIGIITILLVLWTEREAFLYNTNKGEYILEFLFFICMTVELFMLIQFLTKNIFEEDRIWKSYLLILVFQTVAMLPLYNQNFMYGDDLWGFASDYAGDISGGLFFSRPFMRFLKGPLLDTSFQSIRYFRMYNGLLLWIFGCVLFKFVYSRIKNINIALVFSILSVSSCFAIDCIAYASVYPINMSLLSSAISFVLYLNAKESEGRVKYILFAISAVCLFNGFCMYQIGTPIVFVMYVIYEKSRTQSNKKRFGEAFFYMLYYALVAIMYLSATKVLQVICGVVEGQSARGQLILVSQIPDKIEWFFTEVIPQSMNRLVGIIFGNHLFDENNMFYNVTFSNEMLGVILVGALLLLIIVCIIMNAIRLKSGIYGFIAVVAIPLSFWPFLVLPESHYLSYYAIGTILLFLWYLIDGIGDAGSILIKKVKKISNRFKGWKGTIIFICSMAALESNSYAQNAWVNYCRDSYEYLANSICSELVSNPTIDTISVQGGISPYVGGREYVIFCVENILTELKYSPQEYNILQNNNPNYISIFNDKEAGRMEEILGQKTMDKLLNYYYHDDLYERWIYSGQASEEDMKFLRECFVRTEQLAEKNERTLFINLDGFNYRNKF